MRDKCWVCGLRVFECVFESARYLDVFWNQCSTFSSGS